MLVSFTKGGAWLELLSRCPADCAGSLSGEDSYLVDPASSHMLVSKIKRISKYKH